VYKFEEYQQKVIDLLEKIRATQRDAITEAAEICADAVASGGVIRILGSGHSLITALEAHGRAGGLAAVDVIFDPGFGRAERLPGYAETLLARYPITERDVIVVVSNSGRNALPIEVALWAKERGIKTIALTSLAHSRSVTSRHPSGKRLFEIADVVVDNCCEPGDAVVEIPGVFGKVGATSSVACTFLINSIFVQTDQNLVSRGIEPPVLISANLDGTDEHNNRLMQRYRGRVIGL